MLMNVLLLAWVIDWVIVILSLKSQWGIVDALRLIVSNWFLNGGIDWTVLV
jgi:hypothetical protein